MNENADAYRRLKRSIDQDYPRGWFVAVADDQVIGAAADFHALEAAVRTTGKDPREVLIVEAGATYPEDVTIFAR